MTSPHGDSKTIATSFAKPVSTIFILQQKMCEHGDAV